MVGQDYLENPLLLYPPLPEGEEKGGQTTSRGGNRRIIQMFPSYPRSRKADKCPRGGSGRTIHISSSPGGRRSGGGGFLSFEGGPPGHERLNFRRGIGALGGYRERI
jgi:hypothetical protein